MIRIRMVKNVLTDNSETFDLIISDDVGGGHITLHPYDEKDAEALMVELSTAIDEYTADQVKV